MTTPTREVHFIHPEFQRHHQPHPHPLDEVKKPEPIGQLQKHINHEGLMLNENIQELTFEPYCVKVTERYVKHVDVGRQRSYYNNSTPTNSQRRTPSHGSSVYGLLLEIVCSTVQHWPETEQRFRRSESYRRSLAMGTHPSTFTLKHAERGFEPIAASQRPPDIPRRALSLRDPRNRVHIETKDYHSRYPAPFKLYWGITG